jgi:hypothetical protein
MEYALHITETLMAFIIPLPAYRGVGLYFLPGGASTTWYKPSPPLEGLAGIPRLGHLTINSTTIRRSANLSETLAVLNAMARAKQIAWACCRLYDRSLFRKDLAP